MVPVKHVGLRTVVRTLSAVKTNHCFRVKRPSVLPVAVVLLLTLNSGCSGKQTPETVQPEQWVLDKPQVVKELERTRFQVLELEQRVELLREALAESNELARTQQQELDAMKASFRAINNTVQRDRKVAQKQIQDLKAKSAASPSSPQSATATVAEKGNTQSSVKSSKKIENPEERDSYSAAYLAFKSNRFIESSKLFAAFVQQYPQGEYTAQAQYWLAESLMAENRYQEAEQAFKSLVGSELESAKAASAMFDLSKVQLALGKPDEAKATLEKLIADYPDTKVTDAAKSELSKLSSPVQLTTDPKQNTSR